MVSKYVSLQEKNVTLRVSKETEHFAFLRIFQSVPFFFYDLYKRIDFSK